MIEGSERFHFLGVYQWRLAHALVFREGMFIAAGLCRAQEEDSHEDADDAGSDGEEAADLPQPLNMLLDRSLPVTEAGWHPFEALLYDGDVDASAIDACAMALDGPSQQRFQSDLQNGRYASHTPATALHWLCFKRFGTVSHWSGQGMRFMPADGPALKAMGLNADLARQRLAHPAAAWAPCMELHVLGDAWRAQLQAIVPHAPKPALVFDRGILIQAHSDPELIGWHPAEGIRASGRVKSTDLPAVRERLEAGDAATLPPFGSPIPWAEPDAADVQFVFSETVLENGCVPLPRVIALPAQRGDAPSGANLRPDEIRSCLQQSGLAPLLDPLIVRTRFHQVQIGWDIDAIEWAQRIATATQSVAAFKPYRLHQPLLDLARALFKAQQPHEADWMRQGIVRMPFNALLDLMQRDRGMRRAECRVALPMALYPSALKLVGLTVQKSVQVASAADLQREVGHLQRTLVLLGTDQAPLPSIYVTQDGWVLTRQGLAALDDVRPRLGVDPDHSDLPVRGLLYLA